MQDFSRVMQNKFYSIPEEMRLYRSWCVWRYEDLQNTKPTKVPYCARNGTLASVSNPETWSTFDEAIGVCAQTDWYSGIGFILSESDPYCFIDLDDPYELLSNGLLKHDNPQIVLDRQVKIFNEFASYAERSPSGKGLHIIIRGAVPSGRRRSAIEIYSSGRYMTMTGDVYRDLPILDYNATAQVLYEQMSEGKNAAQYYAGLEHAKLTDEQVLDIAGKAANAEKFNDLYYHGNWQKHNYPSQSEADFALIDIIAFYSENRLQVQNLFLKSKLGQREKSRAQYRINYMLNKCFDRMLPPVDIEGLQNRLVEAVAKAKAKSKKSDSTVRDATITIEKAARDNARALDVIINPYTVPPGLLGDLARFIFEAAPRPVPEIALAGAIGLMAGVAGRAYNVSGTGLNQYVLLLAPTGTGKEAIASGIDKLMAAVLRTVPAANEFVGPAEISSAQALTKYMTKTSASFVSIVGEFGLMLSQMSSMHAAPHLLGLRRMLLDLYNKSGEGKQLRPTIYSDKEKNTATITAPAFTLLGESTPERFYETLNESMISEGLLPRITTIEYHGNRPALNAQHTNVQPSFVLIEQFSTLCAHALNLNSQHKAIRVGTDANAKQLFDAFDIHCDTNINSADKEIRRHLWNRAHIKSMKLAALVALGCNPYEPMIDEIMANWALAIVVADVRNLLRRFDAGEIGIDNDETKQLARAIQIIKEYVIRPWSELEVYRVGNLNLHAEKIIPYSFLHKRLCSNSEFKKDKQGASQALKRTLKTLIERGDIEEVNKQKLSTQYGTSAACYMIATPRAFGL